MYDTVSKAIRTSNIVFFLDLWWDKGDDWILQMRLASSSQSFSISHRLSIQIKCALRCDKREGIEANSPKSGLFISLPFKPMLNVF